MAVKAAEHALKSAAVTDLDTVIVATSTAASTIPSTAAQVAARLGLANPAAFDLNTACAGFCYALVCADSLIRSGTSRRVHVIAATIPLALSRMIDSREIPAGEPIPLFGFGAGLAYAGQIVTL
ncbi:3-oxoacyl-[acyl-carrier-protein] synthase-3 [Nonomuraea solani]|uniref:3-oxoacyl-[acyl-carrier-protein] synthase-3 n=1 Tax=Nonomuraea solani TaxID=1144553 RepID=A0A1H6EER2_9ACTN|nr:3-oxoacyl-[acyl-carrier-protein] synthase III C-terminal domain-containing protein [Nonomuraea solani]SEG95509.1 3-oxoacyl-[acyl-carrier-protein] synthase-3 [Nonomuraea solani]